MSEERPVVTVQLMLRACQGLKLYPAQHPSLQKQIAEWHRCLQQMLLVRPEVVLGVHQRTLFCNDFLFVDGFPSAESLRALFESWGIGRMVIRRGVQPVELADFLVLLTGGRGHCELLAVRMQQAGIRHLEVGPEDEQEASGRARRIYEQAISVTESIINDVRIGKIPQTGAAIDAVRAMVETTLAEPHALLALTLIKDYDDYTFRHSVNVSVIALAVGRACGLDEAALRVLGLGALLHDLGKLKIDIGIINKPGQLTSEEFERIQQHPEEGVRILQRMEAIPGEAIQMALGHHLRYDRQGYPRAAARMNLPETVHMVAIADAYDAMTTLRPYQQPMTPRKAVERMLEVRGSIYHPELLARFAEHVGPYPVGSLVRLTSSEVGLVTEAGMGKTDGVSLKILFDAAGHRLRQPEKRDLATAELDCIVADVDPASRGILIADYLD
ncbi:putative nucleotidyltransferase with HDIG domain [Geothermobacter ehrlichii]|uniref:Putative nucleotidyltransferase with HDIG domain n=1 Tax=Geothermobacter ehrlichii TaxID=213224 RepID=A0A5D3WKG2_9BACT|nr:HD-GYP domain-containing protein [Geothermobacter ehrlichii]TYO99101.1 putative nucleotidyltransferase with HDIG domain [Geothermobacter ehrlichii]